LKSSTAVKTRVNTFGNICRLKEGRNKMTEKERQQLMTGLGIWNLELKPEVGRRAKKREPIFGCRARANLLNRIFNRLKSVR